MEDSGGQYARKGEHPLGWRNDVDRYQPCLPEIRKKGGERKW